MNEPIKGMSCAKGCWVISGGIGFAGLLLLLVVFGTSWPWSIFLSLLLTGVAGLVLPYLLCRETAAAADTTPASASAAPEPAAPKPAAPSASAAPKPAEAPAPQPAAGTTAPEVRAEAAAAPPAASASAVTVKPSRELPGQTDLAGRKGEWKYTAAATPGAAASEGGGKPATLAAARPGGADDLTRIRGIGPKLEALCNALGIYHFDQIAAWSPAEIDWVDQNLEGFKGRVTRDNWVAQAQTLAAGGTSTAPAQTGNTD
ncbi:endonuclease [Puniceibacterium confluentis]|uniref:endonuclease n=1 Tax=Puniceibacterium confluentis TaxID=1958944 RepID=UPI001645CD0C|nr:endonuclease [Puniceibacterium confluentis]